MSRFLAKRTFLAAVVIALLLPGLVQAKRFKRYPDDLAEAQATQPAQQPQRALEPGDYAAPADDEEAPGLFGYALHGSEGLTIEYIYTGDVFNNARGGLRTRRATEYLGLFDIAMTADMETLGLLPGGTVFMLAEDFHGKSISGPHVGDFQGVDNIDAGRTNFQLSEFWWEGSFLDGEVGARIGKQDANAEFGVAELGGDFVNSSFGMHPTVPMPAWPDPAMGVVTFFQLTEWLSLNVGVFDGAADGRTWGVSGTGEIFSIYELKTQWDLFGTLPGDYHVGLWYHSGNPEDPGNPAVTFTGNHGVEMCLDQLIFRESLDEGNDQGLGVFAMYGWAPEERNPVIHFFGAGLVYKGLIGGRDDDILGVGVANVNFSDRMAVPTDETAIELFYKIPLSPYFMIQPDVQYICNPSGVQPDSFIVGLRFETVL